MRSVVCLLACLMAASSSAGSLPPRSPLPAELSSTERAAGPRGGAWASPVALGGRRPLGVRGLVVRGFDPPARPWLAGHRGVDLAAGAGEEIYAAGSGVVEYAGRVAGRGVVAIAHTNGLRTTYLPVLASVRPGQSVAASDVIGVIEDVPGHCRMTCLHWGLLRGRSYLDPLLLFGLGRVRLLPLWPASTEGQARG
ncbi:murein hydrolase activator EnvC family protein [Sphaerimonospora cavernae]|uniref:Murein hydrolase activator EnvC family protein n=1 Tax=Sphaerimonospora cavernae TaxID=1740611 RepID=A0ABV6UD60_9ACTN